MDLCADTRIGKGIDGQRALWAVFLASVLVALDLVYMMHSVYATPYRVAVLIICLVVYGRMSGGRMESLGLILLPAQPIRYWVGIVAILCAIMSVVCAAGFFVSWLAGHPISIRPLPIAEIPRVFYFVCISAPVFEEIVYRLALCVAATALLGPKWTIVVSGVVFAAYHIIGGVGAPNNMVAGFILGWAFLKSGSLTVPIVLHALGNIFVVSSEIVMGILTYGITGHS